MFIIHSAKSQLNILEVPILPKLKSQLSLPLSIQC